MMFARAASTRKSAGQSVQIAASATLNHFQGEYSVQSVRLDPTSLGFTLSMAMECAEEGIRVLNTAAGELRFGASDALLEMIHLIAHRNGDGSCWQRDRKYHQPDRPVRLNDTRCTSRDWKWSALNHAHRPTWHWVMQWHPLVRVMISASMIGILIRR